MTSQNITRKYNSLMFNVDWAEEYFKSVSLGQPTRKMQMMSLLMSIIRKRSDVKELLGGVFTTPEEYNGLEYCSKSMSMYNY